MISLRKIKVLLFSGDQYYLKWKNGVKTMMVEYPTLFFKMQLNCNWRISKLINIRKKSQNTKHNLLSPENDKLPFNEWKQHENKVHSNTLVYRYVKAFMLFSIASSGPTTKLNKTENVFA